MTDSEVIVCHTDRREHFSELLEGRDMTKWKMEYRRWLEKGLLGISDTNMDRVSSRCYGHVHLGWEPSNGVADASYPTIPQPNAVASV
jgi:hypothetical protein